MKELQSVVFPNNDRQLLNPNHHRRNLNMSSLSNKRIQTYYPRLGILNPSTPSRGFVSKLREFEMRALLLTTLKIVIGTKHHI